MPAADAGLFSVDHPEQFPLAAATEHPTTSELVVTGTVTPDVSRNVPVVSLASGRVVAIHARLGDTVQKGQLLMTIRSDDVSGGYSNYRMAVADEVLARAQLERAKDLYEHGAIALNDLQVAQDTEDKAKVAVETTAEHLRCSATIPTSRDVMVDIFAPVSGVITDQQVTNAAAGAGLQHAVLRSRFPTSRPSGLSATCTRTTWPPSGWAIPRRSRLNAYPDRMFRGKVSNIGAILDPNIRTAKVRIEVAESRNHAAGHVREGHFPRPDHGDAHHCPGVRRPAHARSRFCLRSRARQEVSPRGSGRRRSPAGQHESAGDQVGARARATSGYQRTGLGPRARAVTAARTTGD